MAYPVQATFYLAGASCACCNYLLELTLLRGAARRLHLLSYRWVVIVLSLGHAEKDGLDPQGFRDILE